MRQRPPIIALAGPDGVGKSTVASAIVNATWSGHNTPNPSPSAGIARFAQPLHDAAELLCEHDRKSQKWREWMRKAGESVRQKHGSHHMIDTLAGKVRYSRALFWVIDDLRTIHEASWVHSDRGVVIELKRDGVDYSGHELDSRLPPTLIDAVIPVGDAKETAMHILEITGWVKRDPSPPLRARRC